MVDLGAIARALPGVGEGVACAGTSLESRTYTVNGKAFLFVATKDARLKLTTSAADARTGGFAVGANGWVKLPLGELPPAATVKRWIAESHAAIGGGKQARPSKPAGKRRR
ncbi:MAG TPA: hypothetical protein VFD82_00010 [Planctomycetota bacterium]|nr:hypothetical protein [Planctomycetota bacterium]